MVVLSTIGIAVGSLAVSLAARATAGPVDAVTRALERVQRGDLDTRVAVYDSTQVGRLQQGFNEMVQGLAERERMRQAFGAYVDPELAERILREGVRLEGEEVDVTIMFVDVRGFTSFAERTPAAEVVRSLNRLFERIVPVVQDHGGRVDKFIGDGLMAVFGAPRRLPDHAAQALAAALEIAALTGPSSGLMPIGIGLNSGPVVAGNVGGSGRLEYSVIGDAVNVAARVEAATRVTGDAVLISERTRAMVGEAASGLAEREAVALKGKSELVRLYAPV
jgi:adenylate cyclase